MESPSINSNFLDYILRLKVKIQPIDRINRIDRIDFVQLILLILLSRLIIGWVRKPRKF